MLPHLMDWLLPRPPSPQGPPVHVAYPPTPRKGKQSVRWRQEEVGEGVANGTEKERAALHASAARAVKTLQWARPTSLYIQ